MLAPGLVAHGQRRDPPLVVDGKAAEQQAVVGGERRARDAETQPEREHRPRRGPALLHQQAHREPQVLPGLFEPPRAARVAAHLLDLIDTAKVEVGAAARLVCRQAVPDVVGHLPLDVIAQLAVQLVLHPAAVPKAAPPAHRATPSSTSGFPPSDACSVACVSVHA